MLFVADPRWIVTEAVRVVDLSVLLVHYELELFAPRDAAGSGDGVCLGFMSRKGTGSMGSLHGPTFCVRNDVDLVVDHASELGRPS